MKTKITALLTLAAGIAALAFTTGCIAPTVRDSVPVTTIKINPATGAVETSNPKDTTIKNFRSELTLTNGAHSVTCFESLTTVMNPDNIQQTADGQVKIIKATGDANAQVLQASGNAAGQVVGAIPK